MSNRDAVPTRATREALARVVVRSRRHTGVQLSIGFVTNPGATPPVAALVHGGGDIALRLYLTLWLMATKKPYTITNQVPSRTWAVTLGLTDSQTAGARAVARALGRLKDLKLLEYLSHGGGQPPRLQLLDPAGGGRPPETGRRYIRVGLGLWQRAHIVTLSTPALAIYLVLLELTGGYEGTPRWASGVRKQQYGLSEDTWTRGVADLREAGFLDTGSAPVNADFDYTRVRQTYLLHHRDLDDPLPPAEVDGAA